jgi:methionyl-tRNA synthetase
MWKVKTTVEQFPELEGEFVDQICQKGNIYITTTHGVYCIKQELVRETANGPDELKHEVELIAVFGVNNGRN